jgi:hypothetical protein
MKEFDFKTSGYFSGTIIFFGFLLIPVGLVAIADSVVLGVVLLFLSLIVLTTHYRLKVDPESKSFHDYLWVLGIKFGEKGTYETIEYLFIKKNKITQTMNMRVVSSTIKKDMYDAYLKLSPDEKIHLFSKEDHSKAVDRLKQLSQKLRVKVVDYSGAEPREIGLQGR